MSKMDPLKSYRETQIKTAAQSKLILMLYDGAIKNINLSLEILNKKHKEFDQTSNLIIKVQDIVTELMVSLDFERGGEIAKNLFNVYMYMNRRLLDANIKKTAQPLNDVKKLLLELRDAWAEVALKKGLESHSGRAGGVNIAG